jgi:hypothetical protein
VAEKNISDDEVVYRRIPPGENWFQPPDRVTSGNFKLSPDEIGISVYREKIIDRSAILSHPKTIPGSRLTKATAKEIRELTNAQGELCGLDIIPIDDENDPGHAEIRVVPPNRFTQSVSKALKSLFKLV